MYIIKLSLYLNNDVSLEIFVCMPCIILYKLSSYDEGKPLFPLDFNFLANLIRKHTYV